MLNKKGQGQQFNWLFIAVAGAVILVFFTIFTFKYIEIKKIEENVQVSRALGQTITSLLSHGGIDYTVTSANKEEGGFKVGLFAEVKDECRCVDDNCINMISINDDSYSEQRVEGQVMFMPSSVRTNAFEAWIYPWYYPFYVTSFIYLIEPGKKIYLVYDSANVKFAESVRDELERLNLDFSVEFAKNADGSSEGDKVVYFTSGKPSDGELWVIAPKGDSDAGRAVYLDSGEEVEFVGLPFLFGAMFSDSAENYKCNYAIASKRFSDVSSVYSGKAGLMQSIVRNEECDFVMFRGALGSLVGSFGKEGAFKFRDRVIELNDELAGRDCGYVF